MLYNRLKLNRLKRTAHACRPTRSVRKRIWKDRFTDGTRILCEIKIRNHRRFTVVKLRTKSVKNVADYVNANITDILISRAINSYRTDANMRLKF